MNEKQDLTGQIFGNWTVLKYSYTKKYPNGSQKKYWVCQCSCGKTKEVQQSNLLSGHSRNCGCTKNYKVNKKGYYGKWNITHQMSGSRLYIVWSSMKTRCYNKKADNYKYYGGRGITVCEEWKNNFINFEKWAIANGYDGSAKCGDCTLDRINVNGNYEPNNCRWVDMKTQIKNRR